MSKQKLQVTLSGSEANKRRRLTNDESSINYKPKCLHYVWELYRLVSKEFGDIDGSDIFLSVAIFNQVAAIHNAARQILNNVGEMAKKYIANTEGLVIYGKTYNINRKELVTKPAKAAEKAGLKFEKRADWLGTAQTMITLIEMFGERIAEIRIGVDELIVAKSAEETKVTKVSLYGINPELRQLCHGMNFKQSTKNSMAQSLGVGTVMVILSHNKHDNYSEKWINALARDMAYIPEIKAIAKRLAENKPDSNTTIISLLSQIASVIGSRHQHRVTFPPAVLMGLLETEDGHFNEEAAEKIDFAGKGAFLAYKVVCQAEKFINNYKIPRGKLVREVIYHAMFGTYLSDMSTLDRVTDNVNWANRKDVHEEKVFESIKFSNSNRELVAWRPIKQKYYSKLSSSSMTSVFNSGNSQAFGEQVFAGYVKRRPTEALRRIFQVKETVGSLQNATESAILSYLADFRGMCTDLIDKGVWDAGTVAWRDMATLDDGREGDEVELNIEDKNIYFY